MPDYSKAKIYKIINDVTEDIYIGSTIKTLANRMGHHRGGALEERKKRNRLYTLWNELGKDHFKIILIEAYPCISREELRAREQHHIDVHKPTLNGISSFAGKVGEKVLCALCECEILSRRLSDHQKSKKHIANSA